MGITIADNFNYRGTKPLDARFQFATISDMKNEATTSLYDGCFAYVTATKQYFTYDSNNEVDSTTGKWRIFESGGGGAVDSVNGKTGTVVLDAEDVGALPDNTSIPSKTSDLNNDSGFITKSVDDLTNYTDTTALNTALGNKVNTSSVGTASGVAELDSTGKVPSSQLPSYVDDVVDGYYKEADGKFYEEDTYTTEITGETGKIYISVDTNIQYRWTGSAFAVLGGALTLGETSSTAYRGDRGKTAYDHSQLTSGNPHNVSKSDVGLGNVDNTSDLNKPISTAQQTALDGKENIFRYSTMPVATVDLLGKIVQYIGATDTYINGYYYECVESSGSYTWAEKAVQNTSEFQYDTMPTANASNVGKIIQYTGATDGDYTQGYFYKCVLDYSVIKIETWSQQTTEELPYRYAYVQSIAVGQSLYTDATREQLYPDPYGGHYVIVNTNGWGGDSNGLTVRPSGQSESWYDQGFRKDTAETIETYKWVVQSTGNYTDDFDELKNRPDVASDIDISGLNLLMPSMANPYSVGFDERGTEYFTGQYYVYSNGTKKPIYRKDFSVAQITVKANDETQVILGDATNCQLLFGYGSINGGKAIIPYGYPSFGIWINITNNNFILDMVREGSGYTISNTTLVMVFYTKTTDIAQ